MIVLILSIVVLVLLVSYALNAERITVNDEFRSGVQGKTIQLSDGKTFYREFGNENDEVVVLVPGATLSTWVWHGIESQIASAGYHVISYDLFGRGYSDRPDRTYDLEFHYRQLDELINAVVPNRTVNFISLAFGTLIAGEYIRNNPEAVGKLVAIGPDGFGVELSRASQSPLFKIPLVRDYIFTVLGNTILLGRLPDYTENQEVLAELRVNYEPELEWKGFKRAVLSSVNNMPIHDARDLYRSVSKACNEIMLVWGDMDLVTPMPQPDVVADAFPNADIRILNGAGHLPHWDAPDRSLLLILGFLRGNAPTI